MNVFKVGDYVRVKNVDEMKEDVNFFSKEGGGLWPEYMFVMLGEKYLTGFHYDMAKHCNKVFQIAEVDQNSSNYNLSIDYGDDGIVWHWAHSMLVKHNGSQKFRESFMGKAATNNDL
jgi:hypothetical protein